MADRVLFTDALTVTGSPANNQNIRIGFAFGMNAAATLNGLGRWVVAGNSATHLLEVGLYTPTTASTGAVTILGSVTVDTNGAPDGAFLYANFGSPVNLSGGSSYVILSTEVNGGDQWLGATTEPTFAADAGPGQLFDVSANFQHCYTLDLSGDVPAGGCTTATSAPGTSYVPVSALWDGPALTQDLTDVSTGSPAAFGADSLDLGPAPQTLTDVSTASPAAFGQDLLVLGDVSSLDTLILYAPPDQSPHGTDQCPCDDWPFLNTSAELPDSVVYISNKPWHYPDPPIGRLYTATGCLGLATSTVSQEDADAKALLQAIACVDDPGIDLPGLVFGTPTRIDNTIIRTYIDGAQSPPDDGTWVTMNESFGSLNTPGLTTFALVGRGGTITPTWVNFPAIVGGTTAGEGGAPVWGTGYAVGFEATRSLGPYAEYTRVTLTVGYDIPLPGFGTLTSLWAGIAHDVTTDSPQLFRRWITKDGFSNAWVARWDAGSITVIIPPGERWQVVIGGHGMVSRSDYQLPGNITVDLQTQTRLPIGEYPPYEYDPSPLPVDRTSTSVSVISVNPPSTTYGFTVLDDGNGNAAQMVLQYHASAAASNGIILTGKNADGTSWQIPLAPGYAEISGLFNLRVDGVQYGAVPWEGFTTHTYGTADGLITLAPGSHTYTTSVSSGVSTHYGTQWGSHIQGINLTVAGGYADLYF